MNPHQLTIAVTVKLGVRSVNDSVFVYGSLGGHALLPCSGLSSAHCSSVSWTFYKGGRVRFSEEVSGGRVRADSDKSNRTSIMADCSLSLRRLRVEDAGSYVCLERREAVTDVYLSLLTVASPSSVMELRPGGRLVLSCILHTYYDPGSCRAYSSSLFHLSWRAEDGGELRGDRHQLTEDSRCNVTLSTTLQADDHRRRWRCQVNTSSWDGVQSVDFTSTFWSEGADGDSDRVPSEVQECRAPLPISQVVLCVVLPLMVVSVGLFTWKLDRNRAKASAAACRIQETRTLQLGGVHISPDPDPDPALEVESWSSPTT
ncbi:uncharacterized protein LOC115400474 isoform X2 [Salarias fasciatus]|nr:uncharacterized protein LOC115400474 isoform X2 [Salarias fasciatus]